MECTVARRGRGNTVYVYRKKNTQRNLSGAAWVFIHGVTHTAISWQREGVRPVKIKPASILAYIQNRGKLSGHKPQTDTDTLPRITGHGPATLCAQSRCCFRSVGLFWAAIIIPVPSVLRCSDRGQLLPSTADAKFTKYLAPNTNMQQQMAADLFLCAAVARIHSLVSVSFAAILGCQASSFFSLYFHSPNRTLEMCMHSTR